MEAKSKRCSFVTPCSRSIRTMTLLWLVTGSSSGFGQQICLKALAAGYTVVGTVRNLERHRNAGNLAVIEEAGGHVVELDSTWGLERIREGVLRTIDEFGPIDVLVNNAGYPITSSLENFTSVPSFRFSMR